MGKPGSWWVGYILSIRGLFLPTESRDLADGRCRTVDPDDGAGRGRRRLSGLGFLFEHVPFSELCFHRQNSEDFSIFVLNLTIGLRGIFKR